MAKGSYISTDGLDGFMQKLNRIENGMRAEAEKAIVVAGAEAAEKVWREGITRAGHISSRSGVHMVDTIGHTEPEASASGMSCYVYPQGETDKGVRQAQKAYLINSGKKAKSNGIYGRHKSPDKRFKGTRGDKFITGPNGIESAAKQPALSAMEAKLNQILRESENNGV